MKVARPENDIAILSHRPLAVGLMEKDRSIAQSPAPRDHRRVIMRMRYCDGLEATQLRDAITNCVVDQRYAIPEDVSRRRTDKQCALADRKAGLNANTNDPRLLLPC